jgi:hypothetical protein
VWVIGVFAIDDLTEDGPALVAASAVLGTDLTQHLVCPDTL